MAENQIHTQNNQQFDSQINIDNEEITKNIGPHPLEPNLNQPALAPPLRPAHPSPLDEQIYLNEHDQ